MEAFIILLVIGVVELNILSDESVRSFCDESNLIFGESLLMKRCHLHEIHEIAFDAGFGMVSLALDFGERVTFEVEVEDNGFM